MKTEKGCVVAPKGFYAAGKSTGLKRKRKDMSLIYSEKPCNVAAVFTTNEVKASSVLHNMELYNKGKKARAIIINSGNANACTGEEGLNNTYKMAEETAACLALKPEDVYVNSTGVIGVQLPMDTIIMGIREVSLALDDDIVSGINCAEGILTTDTFIKDKAVEIIIDDKKVKIGGIAKGSGMIHPNMATMLSFITTDVNIDDATFKELLKEIADDTYNMISVDGDTSTNDSVIALANGMAGNELLTKEHKDYNVFKDAFTFVCKHLATQIVKDGEGATKFMAVNVLNADTKENAKKIAKSIIGSSLVKTAFFGEDANWGRVLCAAGYSGVKFNPNIVTLSFKSAKGEIELYKDGIALDFDEEKALEILQQVEIEIDINMNAGNEKATAWGCDLSYEYVKINGEYRS
ncbi:bifunctional ornithine acetyltransferase/N-acetylglutamate synthase [uncultured Anaerofustis sp.]|uniref:bifunctional ornithine acetyltransferase/N-acetylglutamate synthase n=1 Tax=uncultured Anaerofustis sp. TaxID=904996 RepID=UPI0025F7A0CD|nr:bifunctional ornithine acetyltransferase/N-acetylglutamate synthase [uncultured Anaerofustis sp.]